MRTPGVEDGRRVSRRRRRARASVAVALGSLVAVEAHAADPGPSAVSLCTSLVWIYGDDDVLHAPADTVPSSPASGFGDRPGYDSLFEGASSRYTGRENWSELDVDGSAPGFGPGWLTRARLALALDASSLGVRSAPVVVEDVGSFVEAKWAFGARGTARPNAVSLKAFPLNADRERVGKLEALGWGGAVGPNWESPYAGADGAVRAGRLELEAGFVRFYAALKTATFLEPAPVGPAVSETSYGAFGGVASRAVAPVGVALDVGHFEHGRLPGGAGAPRATTMGASLRLRAGTSFLEPEPPVGFGMERSPFDTGAPFGSETPGESSKSDDADEPPRAERGIAVVVEVAHLLQRLWDFEHPGSTALASARGAAIVAEGRWLALDLRALALLRNPEFVLRNGSGVFAGQTLPRSASRGNEWGAALGVALTVAHVLRPSIAVGVLRPAFVAVRAVDALGQPVGATVVVRGPSDVEPLPPGGAPVPVFEVRPGLEVRVSRLLGGLLWLQYRRDYNRTRLIAADGGALARGFRSPDRLGYGVALRAVW
jgi:hypothetical protein